MSKLGDDVIHLSKLLKGTIEKKFKSYGIGVGQLQILMTLYSCTQKIVIQKELSRILDVDKGNISRSISKLLDKGYITTSENNDKLKLIKLTANGENILKEMIPLFSEINSSMTQNIDKINLDICHHIIQQMILNLEEY